MQVVIRFPMFYLLLNEIITYWVDCWRRDMQGVLYNNFDALVLKNFVPILRENLLSSFCSPLLAVILLLRHNTLGEECM